MTYRSGTWVTRPIGVYPQQYVSAVDDMIEVSFASREECWAVSISRLDARLLARRLNQCLDATPKRKRR